MPVDLKAFCAPTDECGVYVLHETFVMAGWRYALNGCIAVRVPAPGEPDTVGKRLPRDPALSVFRPSKFNAEKCTVRFPEHDGTCFTVKCGGDHRKRCPVCQGERQCKCPECNHEHECGTCSGTGLNPEYDGDSCECGGTGELTNWGEMDVGAQHLAGKYVILIAGLPGARYDPGGKPETPLCFVADGGLEGVVAALRRPSICPR